MKQLIKQIMRRIPVFYPMARKLVDMRNNLVFPGSKIYWENNYATGGTSGSGSYYHLAEFKADILNRFVEKNNVQSVIEFGCGDGNQLRLANYPVYIGLDVSPTAIKLCKNLFHDDLTKSFYIYDPHSFVDNAGIFCAELALSLDVIYHLVEDDVFHKYMMHLFNSGKQHIIIYSSNYDAPQLNHVRHRKFTNWVDIHQPNWKLTRKIDNPYPNDGPQGDVATSSADFYFFTQT